MSKRRRGFPSETKVKRGVQIVHGDKLLEEKLGRNDPCPCGSGGSCSAGICEPMAPEKAVEPKVGRDSTVKERHMIKKTVQTQRKGDILADQLLKVPSEDEEHGLRCVLYEMLVLALGLVQLKKSSGKFTDLPFGEEQTADTAALLASRVLLHFLYPQKDTMPRDFATYLRSVNKWTAHLTWERIHKDSDYPQPYPADVLTNGRLVLEKAKSFIEECINNYGYKLTSRNAKGYYSKFLELYQQCGDQAP